MPANTLLTGSIVRVAEDVEDKIYNHRPSDSPLVSMIGRRPVKSTYHEWIADTYRAPNADNAAIEGADASYAAQTQPQVYGNRTQIFQDTVSVSNTAEAVKKYGRASEIARLKTKKMVELKRDIEAAVIGSPIAVTATGAVAGKLRGLYGFIATNNNMGVGGVAPNPITNTAPTAGTLRPFTEPMLQDIIAKVYSNGGDASILLVSPNHKVRASSFTGNVQKTNEIGTQKGVNTNKGPNNVVLQTAFNFYGHDFGVTKVVPDRVMGAGGAGLVNTAYVVDPDKMALGQLRPFESEQLATTGDAKNWQIRTEVTLIVDQESTLGAVRDLTATGA